jgi:hypothetical protein
MTIAVELQPISGTPPAVHYQWDADTDIFTATLGSHGRVSEPSGCVEIEGSDGSWLVLDLRGGRIVGVEVALWPDVHRNPALAAPPSAEIAEVVVPLRPASGPAAIEVEAPMRAEADDAERVVYFRIGDRREARSIRLGSDHLLDVDRHDRLAGLWLLNVPPFPATTPP